MKCLILGFILLLSSITHGQESKKVRLELDRIIDHAEDASLYRKELRWDTLRTAIYKLAENAESISDLGPSLKYMLKSLGDEHGRVFYNNQILAHYYSSEPKEHLQAFESEIYNDIQMGKVYKFHAALLSNDIGYLRIVGLPMGNNQKMASEIQSEVCGLLGLGAQKWIIDLRYNGGGNMHPMAEGTALIIGSGTVGGSKGLTENECSVWEIKEGNFYYDDYTIALNDRCALKTVPEVAVLTSMYTASSGEAIAVAFKGRTNTRFFGQKTLGMITVTDWHTISDSISMSISVSYYSDRNDVVYNEYVDVDTECSFAVEPMSEDDECLNEAVKWLHGD